MLIKVSEYWNKFVLFGNSIFWGLKIFYWLLIVFLLVMTSAYFMFGFNKGYRKPKKK